MIEIVKTGMCEDCLFAELELNCIRTDTGDWNIWSISCRNEYACKRMKTKTENELRKMNSDHSWS